MTISWLRRFPLLCLSLGSFMLLLTLVAVENIGPGEAGWTAVLIYAPQHGFAFLPLVLALVALGKRDFRTLSINAVALWMWAQWLMGWNVPLGKWIRGRGEGASFRVMTYNVQRGERGVSGLFQTIERERPDILCLQETQDPPPKNFTFPGDVFKTHFRGWNSARGGDVMTLSRWPLVSRRTWPLSSNRRILETVWETPRGPVRVLNVHISKSEAEKQLQNRDFAIFAAQLSLNARLAAQTRIEQLPALETALAETPIPLIMAGDFNSPPRGPFYRALTSRATDTWKQGGWGHLATFPARWPLVGIDHILVRGARATRSWVPDSLASDHRPLVADVVLDGD